MTRNFVWACFALLALAPLSSSVIEKVEGLFLPVVIRAEIVEIYRVEEDYTYFSMRADKLRDCGWRETIFYLGTRNSRIAVADPLFRHLGKPKSRGVGGLYWAENRTTMTPDQLLNNAHADVVHQCGWRPWLTRTRFYN